MNQLVFFSAKQRRPARRSRHCRGVRNADLDSGTSKISDSLDKSRPLGKLQTRETAFCRSFTFLLSFGCNPINYA